MDNSQWQSLLKMGNDCFHEKQWTQAEFCYSEAYDILAFAYRDNAMSSELLMAWICACHNLSSLYEELGKLRLSLKFLMVPYEYLKEIAESEVPNENVRLVALQGMRMTLSPIVLFTKKYPTCEAHKQKFSMMEQLLEHQVGTIH